MNPPSTVCMTYEYPQNCEHIVTKRDKINIHFWAFFRLNDELLLLHDS